MKQLTFINKHYVGDNVIYDMRDEYGEVQQIEKTRLIEMIKNNEIIVVNLKLATDGRLVARGIDEQLKIKAMHSDGAKEPNKDMTNNINKAALLGILVRPNRYGGSEKWPTGELVVVSPDIRVLQIESDEQANKRVIIPRGSHPEIRVFNRKVAYSMEFVAEDNRVLQSLLENGLKTQLKVEYGTEYKELLQTIFRIMKATKTIRAYVKIECKDKNDRDTIVKESLKILNRQKVSLKDDRRLYDLCIYTGFLKMIYENTMDGLILKVLKETALEAHELQGRAYLSDALRSGAFYTWVKQNGREISDLISESLRV